MSDVFLAFDDPPADLDPSGIPGGHRASRNDPNAEIQPGHDEIMCGEFGASFHLMTVQEQALMRALGWHENNEGAWAIWT